MPGIGVIDRFGANTAELYDLLDKLEEGRKEASRLYLRGQCQESLQAIHRALGGMQTIATESTKLRRKALLRVYLTEYLVVTGTSMVCGFVLWTFMLKRKLYREAAVTKLARIRAQTCRTLLSLPISLRGSPVNSRPRPSVARTRRVWHPAAESER